MGGGHRRKQSQQQQQQQSRQSISEAVSEVGDPREDISSSDGNSFPYQASRSKRSVSFSGGTRRMNPFSILPDSDDDGDSDNEQRGDNVRSPRGRKSSVPNFSTQQQQSNAQKDRLPLRKSSMPRSQSGLRQSDDSRANNLSNRISKQLPSLLTSEHLNEFSNLLNLGKSSVQNRSIATTVPQPNAGYEDDDDNDDLLSQQSELTTTSIISSATSSSKKSKQKKKKSKNKHELLQMYDVDEQKEITKLPSKDELNEIVHHLKEARKKMFEASLRVGTYLAVKSLEFIVIVIELILLIIKYIWIIISTIFYHIMRIIFSAFPFMNKLLLHKHDSRDPFKRNHYKLPSDQHQDEIGFSPDDKQSNHASNVGGQGQNKKIYTLAMEIDETLIYTSPVTSKVTKKNDDKNKKNQNGQDQQQQDENDEDQFEVRVFHPSSKQEQLFKVRKRPYLDIFLLEMSKLFNLVVYSSAPKQYVDAIVDSIDVNKLISRRLYQDHCIKWGIYIKDLQHVGEIPSTIILDSVVEATKLDSENALIIKRFRGEENDSELQKFSKILNIIATSSMKKNKPLSSSLHDFKNTYL